MITSEEDYNKSKTKDLIELECQFCHCRFKRIKHWIQTYRNNGSGKFCSKKCAAESYKKGSFFECKNCSKPVWRMPSAIRIFHKTNQKNIFCSQQCSGTYTSKNKTSGVNRSRLESWIQLKLTSLFPDLEILYNKREAINAELDIYIPSLKIAFELNGIFHYEPIFSEEKLKKTQNNDRRKFQACIEKGISLCVIDTSKGGNFSEKNSEKYLEIIKNIITNHPKAGQSLRQSILPHKPQG